MTMNSTLRNLSYLIGSLLYLLKVDCEEVTVSLKVTSPAANSELFEKYNDYTLVVDKEQENSKHYKSKRHAILNTQNLWPNAIVPYAVSTVFAIDEKVTILESMKHWEDHTCIRFREKTDEDEYFITFVPGDPGQCVSFVGRIHSFYQPQGILLGPGCLHVPVVVHEIGHALGFFHEHTRADRDKYIQVFAKNIIPGYEPVFFKLLTNTLGVGYDYASIMHYHSNNFAKPNTQTLAPYDSNIPIGYSTELSPLDILKANRLYNCNNIGYRPSVINILPNQRAVTLPTNVTCGQVIHSDRNGVFEAPNYPKHLVNQDCAYVIVAPKGYTVGVQFTPLKIDTTPECEDDYVQIYEGSSINPNRLYRYPGYIGGRICQDEDSHYYYQVNSNILTVYFHTDEEKVRSDAKGLRIKYNIQDQNECQKSRCHTCTNTPGSFICTCKDGYYLSASAATCFDVNECALNNGGCDDVCNNYGGGYNCSCNYGRYLQEDGKTCSSVPPNTTPTHLPPGTVIPMNKLGIPTPPLVPATTPQPTTTGSQLLETSLQQIAQCGGGFKTLTATTGSLQTLGYPNTSYPANINCEWDIQCPENHSINIYFDNSFRVAGKMPECSRSQLIISGCAMEYGPYCHLTPPKLITTSCRSVKVSFTSGSSIGATRTGFKLNYLCKAQSDITALSSTSTIRPTASNYLTTSKSPTTTPPSTTTVPTTTNAPSAIISPSTKTPPSTTTMPSTTIPPSTTTPPSTATMPPATTPLSTTTSPPTTSAPSSTPAPQLSQCGGGLKTLTTSTGSIQTLGYPNTAYPVNTNCEWDIQCPDNSVVDIFFASSFRVAGRMPVCPRSQLILSGCGDTYGPFCHLIPPSPITTRCNAVKVTFKTGHLVGRTRTGFQLNYACKRVNT